MQLALPLNALQVILEMGRRLASRVQSKVLVVQIDAGIIKIRFVLAVICVGGSMPVRLLVKVFDPVVKGLSVRFVRKVATSPFSEVIRLGSIGV